MQNDIHGTTLQGRPVLHFPCCISRVAFHVLHFLRVALEVRRASIVSRFHRVALHEGLANHKLVERHHCDVRCVHSTIACGITACTRRVQA
jgi:hypothetical protein